MRKQKPSRNEINREIAISVMRRYPQLSRVRPGGVGILYGMRNRQKKWLTYEMDFQAINQLVEELYG